MKKKRWLTGMAVVLALFLLPVLTGQNYYLLHIGIMCCIFAILAMGLNMLQGYTGLVSIGQAGFYALGAYGSGLLAVKLGISFVVCLLVAILLTAVVGLLLGLTTVRLYGGYLALVTIGFGSIVQLLAVNMTGLTGGGEGLLGIPPAAFGSLVLSTTHYFYLVLAITIVLFLVTVNLVNSKFGRALVAIREQKIAANMMGIDVARYRLFAFVIAACFSGIGGCFYTFFAGSLFPDYFNLPQSVLILIMVTLGGAGTLYGPIIGAVLVTTGFELLSALQSYQMVIYGLGVVLAVMFMPYGLVGVWQRLMRMLSKEGKRIESGAA